MSVPLRQKESILTMAAKFKDSHIRNLSPRGIIYGLKNKVVVTYHRNPLEKATRLMLVFLNLHQITFLRDASTALQK